MNRLEFDIEWGIGIKPVFIFHISEGGVIRQSLNVRRIIVKGTLYQFKHFLFEGDNGNGQIAMLNPIDFRARYSGGRFKSYYLKMDEENFETLYATKIVFEEV